MEDLIIEAVRQYGADVWYCPRASQSEHDLIYGEDPGSLFNKAHSLEVYISSVMGFEGQSEFFTKFVLEIRDPMKIIMARRTFNRYVPNLARPREGDLIYIPLVKNFFEIINFAKLIITDKNSAKVTSKFLSVSLYKSTFGTF